MELCGDISEWGLLPSRPDQRRPAPRSGTGVKAAAELRGQSGPRAETAIPERAPHQPTFGLTIVSYQHSNIRQSPHGLYVYTANRREEIELPTDGSPRELVLDKIHKRHEWRTRYLSMTVRGDWQISKFCLAATR